METRARFPFSLFSLGLALYLALWAGLFLTNNAWSSWNAADVQTLNTLRYWDRDGIGAHTGLFLVQGYTPLIQAIETPELNHHGLASVRSENGKLVQSIYYNHYPSGFLIPEYLLSLLIGVPGPEPFQILQFLLSSFALIGLYLFLRELFENKRVAAFGTGLYATSHLFLGYSYTLTNQPIDDLTRFFLLWLLVKDRGSETRSSKRTWALVLLYSILSLSSLDSLIFIFAFMVLYDIIMGKKWRWSEWALGAGIAVAGRIAQIAQSIVAFGVSGAFGDIFHSFSQRAIEGGSGGILVPLKQRFYAITLEWTQILGTTVPSNSGRLLIAVLVVIFIGLLIYLATREDRANRKPAIVAGILGIAGAGFPLLVPVAGYMPYEGRQWLPSLIVASLWAIMLVIRNKDKSSARIPKILAAAIALSFMACIVATGIHSFRNGSALQVFPTTGFSAEEGALGKAINAYAKNPNTDIVFFYKPENAALEAELSQKTFGYQVSPYLSYTSDRLLLESTSISNIIRDIQAFEEKTDGIVTPIILARSETEARDLFTQYAHKACPEIKAETIVTPIESWYGVRFPNCEI